MIKENTERFFIFYVARLILLSKTESYAVRQYEDDKIKIALKRTILPDDSLIILLKELDEMRVFEMVICPLLFNQEDTDQIFLRGNWEKYLTDNLYKAAKEKLASRHVKIDDFSKFVYKYGPADERTLPSIRTGIVADEKFFNNNLAQT